MKRFLSIFLVLGLGFGVDGLQPALGIELERDGVTLAEQLPAVMIEPQLATELSPRGIVRAYAASVRADGAGSQKVLHLVQRASDGNLLHNRGFQMFRNDADIGRHAEVRVNFFVRRDHASNSGRKKEAKSES